MFRLDSGDTVESAFGSALNTPADEKHIQFDSLDGKLLAMGVQHDLGDPIVKSPRRIALSRGFSKAMIDAKKSVCSLYLIDFNPCSFEPEVTSVASPSCVQERVCPIPPSSFPCSQFYTGVCSYVSLCPTLSYSAFFQLDFIQNFWNAVSAS